MNTPSDLMLILDTDVESLAILRDVSERMGCEHIEIRSAEELQQVLATRQPTIAVLAVDRIDAKGMASLDAFASHNSRPAIILIGSISARVLAAAKRAAKSRGLEVLGVAARPLDAVYIERLLAPHVSASPAIPSGELEQAIMEHELTLLYQPKLAVGSGLLRVQGVEALVRWQHPRRGLLQPRHFLPAAEKYGLMSQLTDFVMAEAVRQAGLWRARDLHLEIVINLSTKLVQDRAFPERLAVLLQEHEFPPQQLVLDVTESPNAGDQNLLLDVFTQLRILGVGLSLDNFGTGLSSLTEIYRMPFSEIKLDHSLIADAPREREARVVVEAIVNLAHALQIAVCAEGVETRQMFEIVRDAGFDTAQGRFFSEPVQSQDIERIVRAWPISGPATTGKWRQVKSFGIDESTAIDRAIDTGYAESKSGT
jgi:EAL domain-containing protein (putative c-di-GMP-specific phosphodiesterase class I)